MNNSFLKINQKFAGALAYVLGPASGLIFYIGESFTGNNNRYVKFHALQSTIVFGLAVVVQFIFSLIKWIPFMGLVSWAFDVLILVAYFYLIYAAFIGKEFKVPIIGDVCWEQIYK